MSSNDDTLSTLDTNWLFVRINEKRRENRQPVLEDALLASKLGILLAVKTNKYANFRGGSVVLTERQLEALGSVLEEHFGAVLYEEVFALGRLNRTGTEAAAKQAAKSLLPRETLLGKFKQFFGKRRQVSA